MIVTYAISRFTTKQYLYLPDREVSPHFADTIACLIHPVGIAALNILQVHLAENTTPVEIFHQIRKN